METNQRKRGRPAKIQKEPASVSTSPNTLSGLQEQLPGKPEGSKKDPGIVAPGVVVKDETVKEATGSIAKVSCFAINIVFAKYKLPELTEKEIAMLTGPINEIEIKYMPALMAKYTDKASPFIELAMAGYMIFETRKPKKEIKKEEPEKEAATIDYCACPAPEPLPEGKCAKCTKQIKPNV